MSFHLKADPAGVVQYGLIAEEVDQVYPELVIRESDGKVQGVRYDELAPMLFNEVQRQRRINAAQSKLLDAQTARIALLEREHAAMQAQLAKLTDLRQRLQAADPRAASALVARR